MTARMFSDVLQERNVFADDDLLKQDFLHYGNWRVNHSVKSDESRVIGFTSKRPFNGSMTYSMRLGIVDWFEDTSDLSG